MTEKMTKYESLRDLVEWGSVSSYVDDDEYVVEVRFSRHEQSEDMMNYPAGEKGIVP